MFDPKPLGDAVASHTGGGTPSRQVPSYWGGGIPWASVKDFTDDAEQIASTQETISQKGLNASASNLIPAGTPLVCTRMAVGRAAMPTVPMAINQDVKALYPAPGITPAYLLAVMRYAQRFAEAQSIGSTVKGIRIEDYLAISVPQAPETEQPKIAEVLAVLSRAIQQTEAIVDKLKQVKLGLLHDLLTRGVDANGELRPSYEEAPHLYQDSKLGWIPRDWTVGSLSASCSEVVDCPHSTPVFTDAGVLVARTMHIKDGVFLEDQASRVSEKQYRERVARLTPEPGDVIFTREAPVGEAFVIPNGMKICLGQRVMLLRPRVNVLSAHYLLAQIYSGAVHERIRTLTSGTTNPHLNVAEVRDFMIPLPPYGEQLRIGERISAVSDRLGKEVCELSKLKLQKAGLMDDLLTGRVRVTPLLAQ